MFGESLIVLAEINALNSVIYSSKPGSNLDFSSKTLCGLLKH